VAVSGHLSKIAVLLASLARAARSDLLKAANELGLTPASRTRVVRALPAIDPDDPAAEYTFN
jgi:phage terminase small subunit